MEQLVYPVAPAGSVVDTYFGTAVADPYRALEEIDAPQTREWIRAQAALSEAYLGALPHRRHIRDRLTALWNYERTSTPYHEADTYVISKNSGLQSQAVVYVSSGAEGERRVLIDPNELSADGTVALAGGSLSHDGKLFAYATQTAGSDWQTWRVRAVGDGRDLDDRIEWSKFSDAAWSADGLGFYYAAFDAPAPGAAPSVANENHTLYYHLLGTQQSADRLVYRSVDRPDWFVGASTSEDGRYLFVYPSTGSNNGVLLRDVRQPGNELVELFANDVAQYAPVDNDGSLVYVRTNEGAPRGKLVAVNADDPADRRDVIPESVDTLESVSSIGGRFIATYLHDAHSDVRVFARDGTFLHRVELPGIGSVAGFDGHTSDTETYFSFASYTVPTTIYRYDVASNAASVYYAPVTSFDAPAFATEHVFYTSDDGTRVPMVISYRRDLVRDGNAPAILSGYGGFHVNVTPVFSPALATWMELGGVLAIPSLRGGGEYGEAWHAAGMLARKQNVFDDFFAAARYLVDNAYTSPPKLAVYGGSNGGLLCAATVVQRPHLIGAALCDVGVLDMLRYAKFTVGSGWIPEYGNAEASAAEFATLYAYSPLHNLVAGTAYPATLVSTADHDDRVFPAHSFKFAAALQRAQGGPAPVLLYVDQKAGHGAGKPTQKLIEEYANKFAFLASALDFTPAIS